MATATTDTFDTASLQALLGPQLTAEQARLIFHQGQEAVVFALMCLAKQIAEKQSAATSADPSTPSGQTPLYIKPTAKGSAKPKGAKPGHPGSRRPTPPRINACLDHTFQACPNCHGPVKDCRGSRTRIIVDIPDDISPLVTEHTIPHYWGAPAVGPPSSRSFPTLCLARRSVCGSSCSRFPGYADWKLVEDRSASPSGLVLPSVIGRALTACGKPSCSATLTGHCLNLSTDFSLLRTSNDGRTAQGRSDDEGQSD